MKKIILNLIISAGMTASLAAAGPEEGRRPKIPQDRRCELCFIMHPEFNLLDKGGVNPLATGNPIDSDRTCGQCHDEAYINKSCTHKKAGVEVSCVQCHYQGGEIPRTGPKVSAQGRLLKGGIRIFTPASENCALCHGIADPSNRPMALPDNYEALVTRSPSGKTYRLTRNTGEIISADFISTSHMNIKDRETLNYPWDIHAMRGLQCSSCHFTENDPRRCGNTKADLSHLTYDPRETRSLGRYLYRPDHQLKTAECESCHDPYTAHKTLPYKKRHFTSLSCQACHTGKLYGPAVMNLDRTAFTKAGSPRTEFRGIDPADDAPMNSKFSEGYVPALLAHEPVTGKRSRTSMSAGNFVTEWMWVSGDKAEPVPDETVRGIFLKKEGVYHDDLMALFDADKDGSLSPAELALNSDAKIEYVKKKLEALGVKAPSIKGTVTFNKVHHGIMDEKEIVRDCASCHSSESRLGGDLLLAGFLPAGVMPAVNPAIEPYLDGEIVRTDEGALVLKRGSSAKDHYVFGHSRVVWLDVMGILMVLASMAGAGAHGALRWMAYRVKKGKVHVKTEKVYMYPLYERVWHWTMAFSVIMLMLTGLKIHYAGFMSFMGLAFAVDLHNAFALIITVNAGLALFYHIATGEIKQFLNFNKNFMKETFTQGIYYVYGIFRGEAHPVEKTVHRKLNPLQMITYAGLLNFLFPYQIITGLLLWGAALSPASFEVIGGLSVIAPLHNFGSWMFMSFLAVHVYLTTTGHTPLANIKAMITGMDEVDTGSAASISSIPPDRKVGPREIIENIKQILKRNSGKE
jgi:thiosulfate reductase cytochrome b subunit